VSPAKKLYLNRYTRGSSRVPAEAGTRAVQFLGVSGATPVSGRTRNVCINSFLAMFFGVLLWLSFCDMRQFQLVFRREAELYRLMRFEDGCGRVVKCMPESSCTNRSFHYCPWFLGIVNCPVFCIFSSTGVHQCMFKAIGDCIRCSVGFLCPLQRRQRLVGV